MRLSKQYSCVVKGDTAKKCMQLVKNVTSRIAQFLPVLERPLASQRKMSKEWLAGSHPLPGVVEPALGGAPWPYWPGC